MHEMLLQKSDGTFELVVWGERLKGSDDVTVQFGGTRPTVRIYDPTIMRTLSGRKRPSIPSRSL